MDKRGEESVGVSFMWLLYVVLTVLILTTLVIYSKDRVTGDEFSNVYTANTLSSFYSLAGAMPGDFEIEYTDAKPYTIGVEDHISVTKKDSDISANAYFVRNGFLDYRGDGFYNGTIIKINKKGDEIFVRQ